MDWLEFWSKDLGEVAWPAVTIYVLHTQKAAVSTLIARIKKGKFGPAEFEIADEVKQLKDRAEVLIAQPIEPPKLTAAQMAPAPVAETEAGQQRPKLMQPEAREVKLKLHAKERLLWDKERATDERLRASGSIIERWAKLEIAIRVLASENKIKSGPNILPVIEALAKDGIISDETASIIRGLKRLRNSVAHTTIEPTKTTADDFADICLDVEQRMEAEENAYHLEFLKYTGDP